MTKRCDTSTSDTALPEAAITDQVRPLVQWVTNLPAPYRYPVWESLARDWRVRVIYLGGKKDHPWEQQQRMSFEQRDARGLFAAMTAALAAAGRDADPAQVQVLGAWHLPGCWAALAVGRFKRMPSVAFYESTPRTHRYRRGPVAWGRRFFLRRSDALLTVGPASTRAVLDEGVRPERIVEGRNAVEVERFAAARSRRHATTGAAQQPEQQQQPELDVLYVGQLIPRKNVAAAVHAWSQIREDGERLGIVGDGTEERSLRALVASLGLTEVVDFLGRLDGAHLEDVYARSKTLVLPSTEEVFGLVVNEALAAGCHAVVSEHAGVADNVLGMQGVFVVPPTVDGLASGLRASHQQWQGPIADPEILSHSPERLAGSAHEAILLAHRVAAARGVRRRSFTCDPDRVAWVTNIPTPYRAALWRAIADWRHLDVYCLAETESNRGWATSSIDAGRATVRVLDVFSLSTHDTTLYAPARRIPSALAASGACVVILDGWESPAFLQAIRAAHRQGRAVVASYRSTLATHRFTSGPVDLLRRRVFNAVDAVLTGGPSSTEAVVALGVPLDRIVTGTNTVDVGFFHRVASQQPRTASPGHRFLYVGQLIGRKNVAEAVMAWSRIRQPSDTFTIVGQGPEEPTLRALVAHQGVEAFVHFAGHLEGHDLARAYADADTFVLPSTEEVWGLVASEALAAGCHVVLSRMAGAAASLAGMRGVFLADPDVADLAAAMALSRSEWTGPISEPAILSHTPEKAAAMVLRATEIARETFERRRRTA